MCMLLGYMLMVPFLCLLPPVTSINAYMGYRKLPPDLQKKIRNHYEYTWKRKTVYDEKEILQNLPTHLRTRVALYLNQDLIRNVAFLRDLGSDCLALLVTELKPFRVGAGYWIFKQGSLGREMCFVHEGQLPVKRAGSRNKKYWRDFDSDFYPALLVSPGTIEILGKKNKQLAVLERGSYFGEVSILSPVPVKRSASVRALTGTDLFALTKDSFDTVLLTYPELREEVQAHAEARLREAMSGKAERDYENIRDKDGQTIKHGIHSPPTPSQKRQDKEGGMTNMGTPKLRASVSVVRNGGFTPAASPGLGPRGSSLRLSPGAAAPSTPTIGGLLHTSSVAVGSSSPLVRVATVGFNPYLSLPSSRPEEGEAEAHIRRTVLKGKEQLESIMHPELAEEIRQESAEAEALLDSQIEAERQFMLANSMDHRVGLAIRADEQAKSNPYIALNTSLQLGQPIPSHVPAAFSSLPVVHSGPGPSSRALGMSQVNPALRLSAHGAAVQRESFSLERESARMGQVDRSVGAMSDLLSAIQASVAHSVQPIAEAQRRLVEQQAQAAQSQQSLEELVNSLDLK